MAMRAEKIELGNKITKLPRRAECLQKGNLLFIDSEKSAEFFCEEISLTPAALFLMNN